MDRHLHSRAHAKRSERFDIFIFAARIIELIAGICMALSGIAIWLHILGTYMAKGSEFTLADVQVFLMFVAPGLLLAFGCFLQTRRRKEWAVLIVFIGAILNLWFTGVNAVIGFFGLTHDMFGRTWVLVNFALGVITIISASINTIASTTSDRPP